jgi:hypothetical protein
MSTAWSLAERFRNSRDSIAVLQLISRCAGVLSAFLSLTWDQARALHGARPAFPPPRPSAEPVTVQRRASSTGVIMVAGEKIALGRIHAGQVVTVHVAASTIYRPRQPHRPPDHDPAGPQHQSRPVPQGLPGLLNRRDGDHHSSSTESIIRRKRRASPRGR